jgi:hypothetical protein
MGAGVDLASQITGGFEGGFMKKNENGTETNEGLSKNQVEEVEELIDKKISETKVKITEIRLNYFYHLLVDC